MFWMVAKPTESKHQCESLFSCLQVNLRVFSISFGQFESVSILKMECDIIHRESILALSRNRADLYIYFEEVCENSWVGMQSAGEHWCFSSSDLQIWEDGVAFQWQDSLIQWDNIIIIAALSYLSSQTASSSHQSPVRYACFRSLFQRS